MLKSCFLLLFILLSFPLAFASEKTWYGPYCQDACAEEKDEKLSSIVPNDLVTLTNLHAQSKRLNQQVDDQIQEWGDFVRWLKGHPTKLPLNETEAKARWENVQEQGKALLEVERMLGINKRRFDICARNCSAYQRVELEKEREQYERLRTHMMAVSPWWLSEDFEKISEKARESDLYVPTEAELKKVFIGSMTSFFNEAMELQTHASQITTEIEYSMSGDKDAPSPAVTKTNMFLRHGDALDLLLKRSITSGDTSLCTLADSKETWNKYKRWGKNSIQVGLITMSLLAGPEGLLASLSARSSLAALGRFGTSRLSGLLPNAALTTTMISEARHLQDVCEQKLAQVKLQDADQKEWRNCINQKENAEIAAILGTLGQAAIPMLPATYKLYLANKAAATDAVKVFQHANGNTVSLLDLSQKSAVKAQGLENVSEKYWEFVGGVYQKRLNLSEAEIKAFIESSKQMESRTHLVMMTRGPPKSLQFEGGVGMVHSKKAQDLMPFEKATGITVPRDQGKVAEIVRLASVSDDNPNLMKDVLNQLATVVKNDGEIKKLYVYTSRIHARLYRRLGIPAKEVSRYKERDVILEIDANEFTAEMLKASTKQ